MLLFDKLKKLQQNLMYEFGIDIMKNIEKLLSFFLLVVLLLLIVTNPTKESFQKVGGKEFYEQTGVSYWSDLDGIHATTKTGTCAYKLDHGGYFLFSIGKNEISIDDINGKKKRIASNYLGIFGIWFRVSSFEK